jgi:hypothetical protein
LPYSKIYSKEVETRDLPVMRSETSIDRIADLHRPVVGVLCKLRCEDNWIKGNEKHACMVNLLVAKQKFESHLSPSVIRLTNLSSLAWHPPYASMTSQFKKNPIENEFLYDLER